VQVTLHLFHEGFFAGLGWNRSRHLGDDTTGRREGMPGHRVDVGVGVNSTELGDLPQRGELRRKWLSKTFNYN
jgi:hypothetical protein